MIDFFWLIMIRYLQVLYFKYRMYFPIGLGSEFFQSFITLIIKTIFIKEKRTYKFDLNGSNKNKGVSSFAGLIPKKSLNACLDLLNLS